MRTCSGNRFPAPHCATQHTTAQHLTPQLDTTQHPFSGTAQHVTARHNTPQRNTTQQTFSQLSPRPISWERITKPLPVRDTSLTWNAGGEGHILRHMKTQTTRQVIEYFITEHGPGLVPDAGTLMTWPPDAVEEELQRRLNAASNDKSTSSLFD